MGDQRRRGRGRSGRGGRIPRKGEGQPSPSYSDETFVSFPLDIARIEVPSVVDEAAVKRVLSETFRQERALATALAGVVDAGGDPSLQAVRTQVERHRDVLQQLARDLDVSLDAGEGEGAAANASVNQLVADQRQSRLGWLTLQRIAYASGDRRVDRAVRPVLAEKERHAQVLEGHALTQATLGLFAEVEE